MIKLTAISYNNVPLTHSMTAVFGKQGGTLGRSEENSFVLPDSKYLVSRKQAEIKSDGLRHSIVNLSRATPLIINGKELNGEQESPLQAGDEIQIGLYLLRAESHLAAAESYTPQARSNGTAQPVPAEVPAEIDVAYKPSWSAATTPAAPTSVPPLAASSNAEPASADALMQAFLNGAGMSHVNLNTTATPEFMEMLGQMLATSVKGTFDLLSSRATLKREVNAGMTMVVIKNNNPLKFLSDSETALTQMLRKKMPGFMTPVEAMEDAYEDLQAHQAGVTAGMHAAVDEVLKRFDPRELEKLIKDRSIFDAVLPAQRKAKMWDQYSLLFDQIYRQARMDFQAIFGKAFVTAYEKEIDRFHDERENAQ